MTLSQLKASHFIKAIFEMSEVVDVQLYGSRARGDQSQYSDIDLCVFGASISVSTWLDILDTIENNQETLLSIDCVHYEQVASESLKEEIDQDGISLKVCSAQKKSRGF